LKIDIDFLDLLCSCSIALFLSEYGLFIREVKKTYLNSNPLLVLMILVLSAAYENKIANQPPAFPHFRLQ
jgi:hypothetical protein